MNPFFLYFSFCFAWNGMDKNLYPENNNKNNKDGKSWTELTTEYRYLAESDREREKDCVCVVNTYFKVIWVLFSRNSLSFDSIFSVHMKNEFFLWLFILFGWAMFSCEQRKNEQNFCFFVARRNEIKNMNVEKIRFNKAHELEKGNKWKKRKKISQNTEKAKQKPVSF